MNKLPLQSNGLSVILLSCCSSLTELKLTVPQISSLFGVSKELTSIFSRISCGILHFKSRIFKATSETLAEFVDISTMRLFRLPHTDSLFFFGGGGKDTELHIFSQMVILQTQRFHKTFFSFILKYLTIKLVFCYHRAKYGATTVGNF